MICFSTSDELKRYLKENTVYVRHGDVSIGNLEFIDNSDLHVVFFSRADYEAWLSAGKPCFVQFSLF